MEKTNRKPWLFAIVIIALCATVVTGVIVARLAFAKPAIAFYGLRPDVIAELTRLKGGFRQIALDPDKPLAAQSKALARCSLVFTDNIASASDEGLVLRWETDARDLGAGRGLMPSAIRRIGTVEGEPNGSAYAIPILLDHFELACSIDLLPALGDSREASLERLLKVANGRRSAGHWPIVCAGGNDENILLLVSALAEAKFGAEGRDRIASALRGGESFATALNSTPLRATLDELVAWRKEGIIHPEWFRMTLADVRAFLEAGNCDIAYMTLSDRRTMPSKTMSRFSSLPIPASASVKGPRELAVPAIVAFVPKGNKANPSVMAFLARLVAPEAQGSLSRATGLAPVNSTADTRDIQAYNVRLWAASCARPVSDVASEAVADPEAAARLARDIRGYIESNGTGF